MVRVAGSTTRPSLHQTGLRRGAGAPHAERAHVGPDFLDIGKAPLFAVAWPGHSPASRNVAAGWPDGVLFLVVGNDIEQFNPESSAPVMPSPLGSILAGSIQFGSEQKA